MSLMLKLLAITLLLSSFAYAQSTSEKVEDFLDTQFGNDSRIKSLDVKVEEVKPLRKLKGWSAYIVNVEAYLKAKPKKKISQKMIWFSDGNVITKELNDMESGESYSDMVKPNFKAAYYKKENLIYGNANAKHKVAIFSDPLCPFCKSEVPVALKYMKKYPKKFAIYYYHFPLLRIHPASAIVTRAAIVASRMGVKDVELKMYKTKVNPREKDVAYILSAFNKAVGSNVTQKEVQDDSVNKKIMDDVQIAKNVFVGGTPTMYVDNKLDKTRKLYKTIK